MSLQRFGGLLALTLDSITANVLVRRDGTNAVVSLILDVCAALLLRYPLSVVQQGLRATNCLFVLNSQSK